MTDLIGGAQLATMTFFAPTSFAIWMISFDVVPRTIESTISKIRSQVREAETGELAIDDQNVLACKLERHSVQLSSDVLLPTISQSQFVSTSTPTYTHTIKDLTSFVDQA